MRLLGFMLLISGLVLWAANSYVRTHLPFHTFLGSSDLGNQKPKEVLLWLAKNKNAQIKVRVEGRIYTFSYRDLGIVLDLNRTYGALMEDTHLTFPRNIITYFFSPLSTRTLLPSLVFTSDFYAKINEQRFNFSLSKDRVLVNPDKKTLVYENNQDIFLIDPDSLKKEIIEHFGKTTVLEPRIHRVFEEGTKMKIDDYNQRISRVLVRSIDVYYENGQAAVATLSREELQNLLKIDYNEELGQLSVGVNEEILTREVNNLDQKLGLGSDLRLDGSQLRSGLISLINARFNGSEVDALYAKLVESPNTQGQEAAKYIEVDLSQQKMYLWENSSIVGIHRISSGLYYPTPPGRYQVLNKAKNAYSDIYHVWMPYWMAFSLDKKVNAYLGIHELPYWVDPAGQTIRRPRDFIGSPHTGGCVSLDVGEAQKVYAWAEVGTPVLIYN